MDGWSIAIGSMIAAWRNKGPQYTKEEYEALTGVKIDPSGVSALLELTRELEPDIQALVEDPF